MSRTADDTVLLIFIFLFFRVFPHASQSHHESESISNCSPSGLRSRQQRATCSAFHHQFLLWINTTKRIKDNAYKHKATKIYTYAKSK